MNKFIFLAGLIFSQTVMASIQVNDIVISREEPENLHYEIEFVRKVVDFDEDTNQYQTDDGVWRPAEKLDEVEMLETPKTLLTFQGTKTRSNLMNYNVEVSSEFNTSDQIYSVEVIAKRYHHNEEDLVNSYVALDPESNEMFVLRAALVLEEIPLSDVHLARNRNFMQYERNSIWDNGGIEVVHFSNPQKAYKRSTLPYAFPDQAISRTRCPYVVKATVESHENIKGTEFPAEAKLHCIKAPEAEFHRNTYLEVNEFYSLGKSYKKGDCVRVFRNNYGPFNSYKPSTVIRVFQGKYVLTDRDSVVFHLDELKDCR